MSAAQIADPSNCRGGRDGDDEVGSEEGRLHQHDLRVTECEQFLELRNDDVVETCYSAEDKEQGKDEQAQVAGVDTVCRSASPGLGRSKVSPKSIGTGRLRLKVIAAWCRYPALVGQ